MALLVGITATVLANAVQSYTHTLKSEAALARAMSLSDLVTILQVERGLTAMYLTSNRSNEEALRKLSQARIRTDKQTATFPFTIDISLTSLNVSIRSTEGLEVLISNHRRAVDEDVPVMYFLDNIVFYTEIIKILLDQSSTEIEEPIEDRRLVAFNSLLRVQDASGIKRALGSTYYSLCGYVNDWFSELNTMATTYKGILFRYYEPANAYYTNAMKDIQPVGEVLNDTGSKMMEESYAQWCQSLPIQYRYELNIQWFDNMTIYISILNGLLQTLSDDIRNDIHVNRMTAQTIVVVYVLLMLFVTVCCVFIVIIIHRMTFKIQCIAEALATKTEELTVKKREAEALLYEILPRSVADGLKEGRRVPGEYYENVTVYFSDIVGFTDIAASLTPQEVIRLLNALYR